MSATEAAKLYGMYLCHSGVLRAFNSGADAENISVHSDSVFVEFRAWYSCSESKRYKIILESCHVKRVGYVIYILEIKKIILSSDHKDIACSLVSTIFLLK